MQLCTLGEFQNLVRMVAVAAAKKSAKRPASLVISSVDHSIASFSTMAFMWMANEKETAMHGAAYRCFPWVINFLAEWVADPSVWNHKNR